MRNKNTNGRCEEYVSRNVIYGDYMVKGGERFHLNATIC
jgi:hypothetical protein